MGTSLIIANVKINDRINAVNSSKNARITYLEIKNASSLAIDELSRGLKIKC